MDSAKIFTDKSDGVEDLDTKNEIKLMMKKSEFCSRHS